MLPVFSSWIVYIPVSLGLYFANENALALVVLLVRMFLCFVIDPFIFTFIPGDTFVIGVAIVMGIYVFGLPGVVAGPLITGVTCTMFEMYREYISLLPSQQQPSDVNVY